MKPPLALSVVAIAADGSETTWWSGDKYAANRPQGLGFRNRVGEGFSDGGTTLPRRIDQDYNDLELYNTLVVVGDDGQIAYEGRIGSTPRSTQGGHSIQVQTAGWMAHARDRKFTEIYVDRDLNSWGPPAQQRLGNLMPTNSTTAPSVVQGSSGAALRAAFNDGSWGATFLPLCEGWYDAGPGNAIGSIWYQLVGAPNSSGGDANWNAKLWQATSQTGGFTNLLNNSGDLWDAPSPTNNPATTTGSPRYAMFQWWYGTGPAGATGTDWSSFWRFAVYGTHGLTLRGTAPYGLYASDVIKDIAARFCPKLNTAGVEDTTLVIPHIVFTERTAPFDAFLLLNGPHNYELAVWENKTLTFRPYDLSDYDWQVRMDQPGVNLSNQGDTTDELANYVVVQFDNVLTGQRDEVGPSDDSSLEDTTVDHPANTHGLDVELTVSLTFPTDPDMAIAFGQSYLSEFNRPKNRGQITVQGHILDAAGHWTQPWMVRAGETISVVDHPNDSPRLITEVSYDHPSRTVTISTDNGELHQLDAVVDFIGTNLKARNLA